jgi:hypothetical protein
MCRRPAKPGHFLLVVEDGDPSLWEARVTAAGPVAVGAAPVLSLSLSGLSLRARSVADSGTYVAVGLTDTSTGTNPPFVRVYDRTWSQVVDVPRGGAHGEIRGLRFSLDGLWLFVACTRVGDGSISGYTGLVSVLSMSAAQAGSPSVDTMITIDPATYFDGFYPYDLEVYNGGVLVTAWNKWSPGTYFLPDITRIYKVGFSADYTTVTSATILQEQSGMPSGIAGSATVQFLGTVSFGRRGVLFVSDARQTYNPRLVVYTFQDAVCSSGYVASTTVPGTCIVRPSQCAGTRAY